MFLNILYFLIILVISKELDAIIGGKKVENYDLAKYMVGIHVVTRSRSLFCGGALFAPKYVLTAANCYMPRAEVFVVAGSLSVFDGYQKEARRIKRWLNHEDYEKDSANDIALLTLESEFDVNKKTIGIIPLVEHEPKINSKCKIFGWGVYNYEGKASNDLLHMDVSVMQCSYKNVICAANPKDLKLGIFKGDNGGPLICNEELAGLAVFGDMNETHRLGRQPDAFASIYLHREWIEKNGSIRQGINLKASFWSFFFAFLADLIFSC